jgi:hypothetical protein
MKSLDKLPPELQSISALKLGATRRRLLVKASGLGALGICTVLVGANPATDIAAHLKTPETKYSGYQESAHVKTYYRSARYW